MVKTASFATGDVERMIDGGESVAFTVRGAFCCTRVVRNLMGVQLASMPRRLPTDRVNIGC